MLNIGVCVSVNHTCIVSILAQGPTNELVEVRQSQGGEDERRVDTKVACCSSQPAQGPCKIWSPHGELRWLILTFCNAGARLRMTQPCVVDVKMTWDGIKAIYLYNCPHHQSQVFQLSCIVFFCFIVSEFCSLYYYTNNWERHLFLGYLFFVRGCS